MKSLSRFVTAARIVACGGCAGLVWALTFSAGAATYVWTGAGLLGDQDFLWSNPYNWAGLSAPAAGEAGVTLVFSNTYPKAVTNDITGLAVASIQFQGSNYVVHGKPSGNSLVFRSTGLGGFGLTANGNNCQFAGTCPLVLSNAGIVTVSGANTLKLSSKVSGPGGITKAGTGTLLFNATQANTYAGTTLVTDGTLDLDNGMLGIPSFIPLVSVPGTLSIGSTNLSFSPLVRLLADDQIADDAAVTVYDNAQLWLNTHDDTIGPLTLEGATVNTGLGSSASNPGILTLNGNVTVHYSPLQQNSVISGKLSLGLLSRVFTTDINTRLNLSASISGSPVFNPGFTKTGPGELLLFDATNTYSGVTIVDQGTLWVIGSTQLFGSTNAGTTVNQGGALYLSGATNITESLTLNGGSGTLVYWHQENVWLGPVTLNGDCRFYSLSTNSQDSLKLNCVIGGPGTLHKTGPGGTLLLDGAAANTFTGGIIHEGGMIISAKDSGTPAFTGPLLVGLAGETNSTATFFLLFSSQIPDNSPVQILKSGTLSVYNDATETLGNVELAGGRLEGADPVVYMGIPFGPGTFVISGNVTNHLAPAPGGGTFGASIYGPITLPSGNHFFQLDPDSYLDVRGVLQGAGALTQTGNGYLTFFNTNSYSGQTFVAGGSFQLFYDGLPGAIDGGTTIGPNGQLSFYSAAVTNETLTLQPGAKVYWNAGTTSRWKGPITLESNTVFFAYGGSLILDGIVSGAGGITLRDDNLGTLWLNGSADNIYAGPTVVNGGALGLKKNSAYAIPGDLVVGNPANLGPFAVVSCYQPNQFAPATGSQLLTRTVTINPNAFFNFNGNDQTFANLVMADVTLDTGAATLSLNRNLTAQKQLPAVHSLLLGKLAFANQEGITNHVLEIQDNAGRLDLTAAISETAGNAHLQKTGPGVLYLSGDNSFDGRLLLSQGTTYADGLHPFGGIGFDTTVESGAKLHLNTGTNYEGLNITGNSALEVSGTNVHGGAFSLGGNATITVLTNSTYIIDTSIAGGGDLTKAGPGRLRLTGSVPNFYTGTTHLAGGFLELAKTSSNAIPHDLIVGEPGGFVQWLTHNQLADGGALIVTNNGGAYLNGFSDTIGSLAGNQFLFLDTGALTVGVNDSSTTYSGLLSGTGGSLTKIGAGTLTLTANNAHTGATTINGGQLVVLGSQPQSPVFINSGTLGGTGTVGNVTAFSAGHISPGSSPGKLSSGTFNLIGTTATLDVEINGPAPGTGYDQVQVTGSVSFMGGTLNLAMNTSGAISNQYVIIANDGADLVGGTFTGLAEGAMLTNNGVVFQITYQGGDGNDVALIQKSLPLPPAIGSVQLTGGSLRITGSGLPNTTYTVEATSTLTVPIPWAAIGSAQADAAGFIQFADSDINHYPTRFYRFSRP